ncbi:MAG: hypothetical protein C4541_11400 [Candidatus Auribacter fodinae]|jgi:hypothetical protein|uniref:Type II secretion system protein n=1 Tax=Candidatus Auribacter fodinae TaxID=2093366 RepID=A0A3A4QVP3_9BACT|nr:MAG: hypothetical protein C4541_11400 [Candidatus Auribacter fodinae]
MPNTLHPAIQREAVRRRYAQLGFTVLDLLICLATLAVVSCIILIGGARLKSFSQATLCETNIRQVMHAAEMYNSDHRQYPFGYPYATLHNTLESYITYDRTFLCPADKGELYDSYTLFYTGAADDTDEHRYVFGCPRHSRFKKSIALFASTDSASCKTAPLSANTGITNIGSVIHGKITFPDGSHADFGDNQGIIIQSLFTPEERNYVVIRLTEPGSTPITIKAGEYIFVDIALDCAVIHVHDGEISMFPEPGDGKTIWTITADRGRGIIIPTYALLHEENAISIIPQRIRNLPEGTTISLARKDTPHVTADIQRLLGSLAAKSPALKESSTERKIAVNLAHWLENEYGYVSDK